MQWYSSRPITHVIGLFATWLAIEEMGEKKKLTDKNMQCKIKSFTLFSFDYTTGHVDDEGKLPSTFPQNELILTQPTRMLVVHEQRTASAPASVDRNTHPPTSLMVANLNRFYVLFYSGCCSWLLTCPAQLIRRSGDILRFLCREKALCAQHMDIIWAAGGGGQDKDRRMCVHEVRYYTLSYCIRGDGRWEMLL